MTSILGNTITCAPCERCGSTSFIIEPGKGPHALGIRCSCGSGHRWISHAAAKALGHEPKTGHEQQLEESNYLLAKDMFGDPPWNEFEKYSVDRS